MGYYAADKGGKSTYIYFSRRSLKHSFKKKSTVDSGDNGVSV